QLMSDVEGLEVEGDVKTVKTAEGQFKARTLIIATGANPRKLGVPGEEEFRGRGVSYCATCDGAFFRDQALVVVGGGDSAIEEALFLTRYARSVTIVHRRGELRAAKAIQEKAGAEPKIRFVLDTVVAEISGADKVERVRTRNLKTGQTGEIPCGGVFIYVGMLPATEFLPPGVRLSDQKYIVTDESLETSAQGVFAAGDCRAKEVRQVVTAVGEGAQAAISAERYITVGARRRA
ncbi:MAG: FAD-dependent oxidoreductase, partial [Actinobacteria bacterium]|nr:FAD-dependent oxidoreductase [Actinomycetota bacterium]